MSVLAPAIFFSAVAASQAPQRVEEPLNIVPTSPIQVVGDHTYITIIGGASEADHRISNEEVARIEEEAQRLLELDTNTGENIDEEIFIDCNNVNNEFGSEFSEPDDRLRGR